MRIPSYEYEVLHQFEVIFGDGERKTQAATRDYSKVWENVIDDPLDVTPVIVYRMNGEVCAAVAGLDDLVENEECAMEIARLAAEVESAEEAIRQLVGRLPIHWLRGSAAADWCDLPAVRRAMAGKIP